MMRVEIGPCRTLNESGAEPARFINAHPGFHAEGARLVRAGDQRGADFTVGDANRFSAQPGNVALFHRRKKRVHVDVQNGPRPEAC
jgi:hypothetical protein